MGKPSTPEPPTPPTASEIAAANIETAEHMAKLSRAMEFGEELMRDVRNEDGSRVKYEKVATDVPTGYEPVYSNETVNTSGPSDFSFRSGNRGQYKTESEINSDGEIVGFTMRHGNFGPSPIAEMAHLTGKKWHSDEVQNYLKEEGMADGFRGTQPLSEQVRTLTGYKSPDGDIITANQYFKTSYDANGKLIGEREAVTRDEAIDVDFTGMGDIDRAVKRWEWEKEYGAEKAEFLLDFADEYGDDFVTSARDLLEKSDPTGFAARELLGQLAQGYTPGQLPDLPTMEKAIDPALLEQVGIAPSLPEVGFGDVPEYERAGAFGDLERLGAAPTLAEMDVAAAPEFGRVGEMAALERAEAAPTLERLTDIPEVPLDAESMAAREFAEEELLRRAQSGETSRLMGEEARRIARGRAAGLGNIFGGGAAIEEAAAVRQAEDAGQRAAISDLLNFYGSGQTAGDYQSRIAQQNLSNQLMGIQQRTGAEQAEFGMGMQRLGADQEATLRERADELAAIGQRTEAEQQEFSNLSGIINQINQTRGQQFGLGAQAVEFDTSQRMRERADELSAMAQRNQAEEGEYQSLLSALGQQGATRQAQYGMELQGAAQRNQAAEADLARQQQAMAQRNQAAQQSFASAMQKTMSEEQLKQQQMANLQSFSGLTPVAAQFGALPGAQQAVASSFQPIQYQPTNVAGLLQNQQQLASKTFGTQANIFGTQAQLSMQSSPFERIAGGMADWGTGYRGFAGP